MRIIDRKKVRERFKQRHKKEKKTEWRREIEWGSKKVLQI